MRQTFRRLRGFVCCKIHFYKTQLASKQASKQQSNKATRQAALKLERAVFGNCIEATLLLQTTEDTVQ